MMEEEQDVDSGHIVRLFDQPRNDHKAATIAAPTKMRGF